MKVSIACVAVGGLSVCVHAQVSFTDATSDAGISCVYEGPGGAGAPFMGGGGAAGDFNRDGHEDLFILSGGDGPDHLYLNQRDGTFTDRAIDAGLTRLHIGVGIAVGDVDNNGWLDVFIASWGDISSPGPGQHLLYLNMGLDESGVPIFSEVAQQAGVGMTSPEVADGFGAAFGDYDLDGDLDLAVAGWMTDSYGNRLFRNDGVNESGVPLFTDVTESAILTDMRTVHGFSPRFCDMNNDLYPELLWVADFRTSRHLINNGDGTFSDTTALSGTGEDRNGMGNAAGDVNNDGFCDWYVSSIQAGGIGNMLYLNQGDGSYTETAQSAGVHQGGWGWGTVVVDINHDTLPDIIETNGWSQWDTHSRLFMNNGDLTFNESAIDAGMEHVAQGRGLITFDPDNDGDQDVLFLCYADPAAYYRNHAADDGGEGANWIRVRLDTSADPRSAPDGVGARVEAVTGELTQTRWMSTGSNYLSHSELSAHFGLAGAETIDELRVVWPTGLVRTLTAVPANQTLTIPSCPVDYTGDGSADVNDVLAFLPLLLEGDRRADLDGNGVPSFDDVLALLAAFGDGCP